MRHQERIYTQTPHSGIRNKIINIVNMSSDICEFNKPSYLMSGATKMLTGATINDTNIHIVNSGTTFDLAFSFTGNVETFINTDTKFKYDIYPYNYNSNVFTTLPIFSSGEIKWDSFSGTSAFTDTLLFSEFIIDGEYLIKGSYDFTTCTGFLSELKDVNNTSNVIGSEYGIYDPEFDNYFALIRKAIKPRFELTPTDTRRLGALTVESTLIESQTEITTSANWVGNAIVSLNGLTLSEGETEDFITIGNTIYFNSPLYEDDIVTVAFINSGNPNGLVSESFKIEDPIPSGATNGEGDSQYYYNTDTGKNEIFTLSESVEFNDLVITLNGVTLANVLDYSQAATDPKRIILNGLIYDGDIITVTYNTFGSYVGKVYVDNFDVYWTVAPAPNNINGLFTAVVANDESFSGGTIVYSATTPYVTNETTYSINLDLSSYSGTTIFYKIVNQKDFTLIKGDIISTTTDSDVIPINLSL